MTDDADNRGMAKSLRELHQEKAEIVAMAREVDEHLQLLPRGSRIARFLHRRAIHRRLREIDLEIGLRHTIPAALLRDLMEHREPS